jgi:hypothetical protein
VNLDQGVEGLTAGQGVAWELSLLAVGNVVWVPVSAAQQQDDHTEDHEEREEEGGAEGGG